MTRLRSFVLFSALTLAACGAVSPPGPTPPGPPAPPPADLAPPPADLAEAPQIVSVSPTSVPIMADTVLLVTGRNLRLDSLQGAVWQFGACPISAYTYAPVDASHCRLIVQVGKVAPASCDLSLSLGGARLAPPLVGAFSLVP